MFVFILNNTKTIYEEVNTETGSVLQELARSATLSHASYNETKQK